jgi:hypothetical protein
MIILKIVPGLLFIITGVRVLVTPSIDPDPFTGWLFIAIGVVCLFAVIIA